MTEKYSSVLIVDCITHAQSGMVLVRVMISILIDLFLGISFEMIIGGEGGLTFV